MKKLIISVLTVIGLALVGISPASADTTVTVNVDGIIRGVPGTTYQFASGDVASEFVGLSCSAAAATDNNGSVHPNNDLIITTGGTTVTIPDVESDPGIIHQVQGSIVLGETINVSVILGSHGVTSGGFVISFTCSDPAPPTTVAPTTVAPTTVAPTTVAPTTTGPDPVGPTIVAPTSPPTTCPTGMTPGTDSSGDGVCTTTPVNPLGPSTTIAVPLATTTAPDPAGPAATLPVTGPSATYLVASGGVALVSLGVGLLALTHILGSALVTKRD